MGKELGIDDKAEENLEELTTRVHAIHANCKREKKGKIRSSLCGVVSSCLKILTVVLLLGTVCEMGSEGSSTNVHLPTSSKTLTESDTFGHVPHSTFASSV